MNLLLAESCASNSQKALLTGLPLGQLRLEAVPFSCVNNPIRLSLIPSYGHVRTREWTSHSIPSH